MRLLLGYKSGINNASKLVGVFATHIKQCYLIIISPPILLLNVREPETPGIAISDDIRFSNNRISIKTIATIDRSIA
jgi:hypothetical protein